MTEMERVNYWIGQFSNAAFDCGAWEKERDGDVYSEVLARKESVKASLVSAIELALEIERERCAAIADGSKCVSNYALTEQGWREAAKTTASAIRENE
jgi:hypothetical protein